MSPETFGYKDRDDFRERLQALRTVLESTCQRKVKDGSSNFHLVGTPLSFSEYDDFAARISNALNSRVVTCDLELTYIGASGMSDLQRIRFRGEEGDRTLVLTRRPHTQRYETVLESAGTSQIAAPVSDKGLHLRQLLRTLSAGNVDLGGIARMQSEAALIRSTPGAALSETEVRLGALTNIIDAVAPYTSAETIAYALDPATQSWITLSEEIQHHLYEGDTARYAAKLLMHGNLQYVLATNPGGELPLVTYTQRVGAYPELPNASPLAEPGQLIVPSVEVIQQLSAMLLSVA